MVRRELMNGTKRSAIVSRGLHVSLLSRRRVRFRVPDCTARPSLSVLSEFLGEKHLVHGAVLFEDVRVRTTSPQTSAKRGSARRSIGPWPDGGKESPRDLTN